jgi:tetratricopeptide (TPR) repeat protein
MPPAAASELLVSEPPTTRRRGKALVAVAVVSLAAAAAAVSVGLGWFKTNDNALPEADLSGAHPLLAESIAAEREAVLAEPESSAAWGRLGMRYMAHHYVEPAIACFERAAKADPKEFRWIYYQAVLLEETDLPAAIAMHDKAVEIKNDYLPGRLRRAAALLRANRLDEAEREYEAAAKLAPADEPLGPLAAAIGAGRAAQARGDRKAAGEAFVKAASIAPWSRTAQQELARASARLGDWERARAAQVQADRLPPGPIEPVDEALAEVEEFELVSRRLGMQADELVAKQDFAGAAKVLEKMAGERPDLTRPKLNLGQIYMSQGRLREAIAVFSAVANDFPMDAMANYHLGMALEAAGDNPGALSRYQKSIDLKPDFADAHYSMGLLLEKLDRRPEAIVAYRHAAEASPGFAPAHLALGAAIHQQGDAKGALEHVRRAVHLAPGDPTPKQYLDRLTKEIGP